MRYIEFFCFQMKNNSFFFVFFFHWLLGRRKGIIPDGIAACGIGSWMWLSMLLLLLLLLLVPGARSWLSTVFCFVCLFVFYPTNNNIQIKQKRRASNVKSLSIIVVFFFASSDLEVGGPFFFGGGGEGAWFLFFFFVFTGSVGGHTHGRGGPHNNMIVFFCFSFFFVSLGARGCWIFEKKIELKKKTPNKKKKKQIKRGTH